MSEDGVKYPLEKKPREVVDLIRQEQWGAIRSLREKMVAKKEIARILGLHVQTVRKYVKECNWRPYKRQVYPASALDPYKPYIMKRMDEVDYSGKILYQEVKEQGYPGSYEVVKLFIRPHRQAQRQLEEATVRFETPPGKQSQADYSTVQVWVAGRQHRAQLFVMNLGYSRSLYAVCKPDQKLPSLIDCHTGAWDHFGGRTEEILYDNPKTIVLSRDYEGKNITWNPQFLDFARYYGFNARLCKPYRAKTKGKVESGVKYVKNNFFKRFRNFRSWEELNSKLLAWCIEVADKREHGTTHRRPVDAFKEEKLISTASRPRYTIENPITRKVPNDCLVNFKANRYSVPFIYAGKRVDLVPCVNELKIYQEGRLLASHELLEDRYRVSMQQAHYDGIFRINCKKQATKDPSETEIRSIYSRSGTEEDVEVRDLVYYENFVGGNIQ